MYCWLAVNSWRTCSVSSWTKEGSGARDIPETVAPGNDRVRRSVGPWERSRCGRTRRCTTRSQLVPVMTAPPDRGAALTAPVALGLSATTEKPAAADAGLGWRAMTETPATDTIIDEATP